MPKSALTYTALADLSRLLLDPIREYFGDVKPTYGFCSAGLTALVSGGCPYVVVNGNAGRGGL